ncbi:MAG: bacillithiol system redox-active protein YtxJ [Gemmatimonadales bacterium]|jgi:bacillithiol system protein YtxJ
MAGAVLDLHDVTELDEILKTPCVVIYKHSNRCGISAAALLEVRHFAETHVDVPVYKVDVVAQRSLSLTVANRLGVRHASPQALVVKDGQAVWSTSHFRVTARAIEGAVADG